MAAKKASPSAGAFKSNYNIELGDLLSKQLAFAALNQSHGLCPS